MVQSTGPRLPVASEILETDLEQIRSDRFNFCVAVRSKTTRLGELTLRCDGSVA